MLNRLTIQLSIDELRALDQAARQELRPVKDQVRVLLRCELARRGLLSPLPQESPQCESLSMSAALT